MSATQADAASELQAASDAQASGPMSADERAAMEMQAAMDAERAERAAKAAAPATERAASDRPEPLCLAVRTSLLSEFRNSGGVLQAFDVCHGQTTFGVLCAALSRMPGVVFPDHDPQSWFRRPSRFTFREQLYEISIPHENIRVCPVNMGLALIEMEEVLEFVRHNVLRSRPSRYTLR
ncbi:MAG: hypothetical protein WDO68_13285 [Gammaproteobacteria bacterium]